jgi:hypothetical protein
VPPDVPHLQADSFLPLDVAHVALDVVRLVLGRLGVMSAWSGLGAMRLADERVPTSSTERDRRGGGPQAQRTQVFLPAREQRGRDFGWTIHFSARPRFLERSE